MTAHFPELAPLVPRQSLREIVTKKLRTALLTGRLTPGKVYSAPAIAIRFGVSATPVREAMLDLAKEGLVEPVRNKGFRVVPLDERALDECTSLRQLIEPATIAQVTMTATIDELEQYRGLAHDIVTAACDGDIATYIDTDMRFHLGLLGLSGNQLLVDTVRDLRYRSRLMGIPRLAESGELIPSAHEHLELLDHMIARDATAARQLMRSHLDHVRGIWAQGCDADTSESTPN